MVEHAPISAMRGESRGARSPHRRTTAGPAGPKGTFLVVLLVASLAHADPAETDSPVLAPDLPGVSVRLRAGETAPYDGRLIELSENVRRGKALVECRAAPCSR